MKDRTGEINYNKFGSKMIIKEYRGSMDMDVYFPKYDYTKKHVAYKEFNNGNIKCAYEPKVFGVGYIGEGRHNTLINGKRTKCYDVWRRMIERCYSSKYHDREPTYIDCEVHKLWHNFQTFSEWFENNFYQIEGQRMELDKDILCKGNKMYSPDACVFVPQRINSLFIKRDNDRGDYPLGVTRINKKYRAYCHIDKKNKYLGTYTTPEQAFQAYKNFKEQYIKEIAEEYKNVIPQKLYEGMIKYQVEIND